MSTILTQQGTSVPPFTLQDIKAIQIEAYTIIDHLPNNRILQLMGMLNTFSHSLAVKWGGAIAEKIFTPDAILEKTWRIVPERLKDLTVTCLTQLHSVTMTSAVTWLQGYLRKFWDGACSGFASIRCMRKMMATGGADTLKLFDFTPHQPGKAVAPPEMSSVNFPKMLIIYELCEEILVSRVQLEDDEVLGSEMEKCLPKHQGALMREMYNAVFGAIASYRRVEEASTILREKNSIQLPDAESVAVPQSEPPVVRWKPVFKIKQHIWNRLVQKLARGWKEEDFWKGDRSLDLESTLDSWTPF